MRSQIPVLSLWQPWATAIALKLKKNETRSWSTGYRGWLGIHAAKRPMTKAESRMIDSIWLQRPMPFGAVVCIVRMVGCERTESVRDLVSDQEEWWGDYSDGRFAWITSPLDMIELAEPIPLLGHQGLFPWRVPEELRPKLIEIPGLKVDLAR